MEKFKNAEEKHRYMQDTPMPKLITSMALPSVAAMLITSLYNLADTFFVSQFGTYATGAVSVNGAIDNIIMMAGSFLAVGTASYASRLIGAQKESHATEVLSTCFFLAFLTGVAVLVFGTIYQGPLLMLLGADENILPYSEQYCKYILLAAPVMCTSFVLNQSLRSEGNSLYSMIGTVSGALLNIILDPIFIFVFNWGVAGASAATALSKLISWIILLIPYLQGKTLLKIKLSHIRPRLHDAKEVCAIGGTSFFRNGLATLAAIYLNRIAVEYSGSALAAIGVANRIMMFLTSACLGFSTGFQPVAGYSWGAGRYDRVKEAYHFSMKACICGISLVALIVALAAKPLLNCFTTGDQEMIQIGVFSLRIQCLVMPLHAYCIIVNMMSSALGRAFHATLLAISRQGICFYPLLPIFTTLFGVWGIASVQGAADALSMLLALPIAYQTNHFIEKSAFQDNRRTA